MTKTETILKMVKSFQENHPGDFSGYFTDDGIMVFPKDYTGTDQPTLKGKESIHNELVNWGKKFHVLQTHVHDIFEKGDKLALYWTVKREDRKTKEAFTADAVAIIEFDHNKIKYFRVFLEYV